MTDVRIDTPLMRQYWEIKENHRDAILLFRLGDFYEMFFDDAKVASKLLDIALTSRDKNAQNPVPLCGVPYHSVSGYIATLLEHGHKVAVCEQTEDPKFAKGIVKRDVVRVITPGLRTDLEGLAPNETNSLVSLFPGPAGFGLAWIDVSTGSFSVATYPDFSEVEEEIHRLAPKELLIPELESPPPIAAWLRVQPTIFPKMRIEKIPPWVYDQSEKRLAERFEVSSLVGFGFDSPELQAGASVALVHYIEGVNRSPLPHLSPPQVHRRDAFTYLDSTTEEHLELFRSRAHTSDDRTLFGVLNETETSFGARKLKEWIRLPLRDPNAIVRRQDVVQELVEKIEIREQIRSELSHVYDLERLSGRIATSRANARDLVALRSTLLRTIPIRNLVQRVQAQAAEVLYAELNPHSELVDLLSRGLMDDPPVTLSDGGLIRDGFDAQLDDLRTIRSGGKAWIAELESRERERTGINSLKIGYNRVFGYYIEVTKANISRVPNDYERRQTLSNGERYVTPGLKEQESKILSAEEKMVALELEIFERLRKAAFGAIRSIQKLAESLAQIDVYCALALVASRHRYVRPKVTTGDGLRILAGRHPVVERFVQGNPFVPNGIEMNCNERQMIILTGPNMAGKSTIMRQVALIVLLAQMGSFVPAEEAEIGIVDRIFTRVGASDDLAGGRSTFMVEMSETANILRSATKASLILLDEIGRGTSTFDGLSIAWAVAEDLHDRVGAKTIFATHYHELTDLVRTKPRVQNMNVSVKEWGDRIVFLRKLSDGAVNRSYGIEVARLAGVPARVLERSREILANLEHGELDATGRPTLAVHSAEYDQNQVPQLELFRRDADELLTAVRTLDSDTLTPKAAHDLLCSWQKRFSQT